MPSPRIELVLTTKNAMPHLKKTFNALKATKYSNLKEEKCRLISEDIIKFINESRKINKKISLKRIIE